MYSKHTNIHNQGPFIIDNTHSSMEGDGRKLENVEKTYGYEERILKLSIHSYLS